MAKVRERQCEFYICEGSCSKGREGTFYNYCQTCNKYAAKAGARPNRVDRRKEKLNKINKKEMRNW